MGIIFLAITIYINILIVVTGQPEYKWSNIFMKNRNKRKINYDAAIAIPPAVPFDGIEIHPVSSYMTTILSALKSASRKAPKTGRFISIRLTVGSTCIADCIDQRSAQNFETLLRIVVEHFKIRS